MLSQLESYDAVLGWTGALKELEILFAYESPTRQMLRNVFLLCYGRRVSSASWAAIGSHSRYKTSPEQ
jgi:hypothetical protein